ncbi:MAG: class I SAM-dependent methyltransferase [Fimbriimonadales bacterium]
MCTSTERRPLYTGLRDKVYKGTPGEWDFYQCAQCQCGYFDPRPTPQAVGKLYVEYYTHTTQSIPEYHQLSLLGKVRRILGNGYRNYRFGTNERPASPLGILVAWLMRDYRALLDAGGRHLPKAKPNARLLDVGCGSGDFMLLAQRAGWQVMGVEPDPEAVKVARQRGLKVVEGDIHALKDDTEAYDGITLNHVIEHVHDPIAVLSACYRLLRPGGWLWIETPNLNAQGHARFGADWVGLDIPRHLVVFTYEALCNLLHQVGFAHIEQLPYYPLCERVYAMSHAIATGQSPHHPPPLSPELLAEARRAERRARTQVALREFVMVRAWKVHR